MFSRTSRHQLATVALLKMCCLFSPSMLAEEVWLAGPRDILPSLVLPVLDVPEPIDVPLKVIRQRIVEAPLSTIVDPVTLSLTTDVEVLHRLSRKIAQQGKAETVFAQLSALAKNPKGPDGKVMAPISYELARNLDKAFLTKLYSFEHHKVVVMSAQLRQSSSENELMTQLQFILPPEDMQTIAERLTAGRNLAVDRDLLPQFARKRLKRYSIYRGPNCFHASLAFHSSVFTTSRYFNVKAEKDHHVSMVNYDELWRILVETFYELPAKQKVKYGDILVFFDVPPDAKGVDFRWIKHTAVFLFGNYVFSKGSKSANSTYLVRTVQEEWDTWNPKSKHLAIKIFRRGGKNVKNMPPRDLIDWIF